MKKQFITAISVIIAIIAIVAIIIYEKKPQNDANKVAATTEHITYVLKDYKGRIAIYENDSESPVTVYEVNTNSLPEEDAKRIRTGIKADNSAELHNLIEAYLS